MKIRGKGMAKYGNKKVKYDGYVFDSEMEKNYYIYLLSKHQKSDIEIQPEYELQPKFRDNGNKLIRPITYTADFKVGNIVFDVKGMLTQQGEMRIKMFKYKYPEYKLNIIAKAPKYTGKEWIELDELKKVRKQRLK